MEIVARCCDKERNVHRPYEIRKQVEKAAAFLWKNSEKPAFCLPPKFMVLVFISCLETAHVTPTCAAACCESDAIFVCAAGAGGGRSRQTLLKRFGYLEMASIQMLIFSSSADYVMAHNTHTCPFYNKIAV